MRAIMRRIAALVAGATAVNSQVTFTGLAYPTGLAFDNSGNMIVVEKAGLIKTFPVAGAEMGGNGGRVLLDHRGSTASYGDMGFLSVAWTPGWLWGVYQLVDPAVGNQCTNPDAMIGVNGVSNAEFPGCVTHSLLSRWPYANGAIQGNEQIIMDGRQRNGDGSFLHCTQVRACLHQFVRA